MNTLWTTIARLVTTFVFDLIDPAAKWARRTGEDDE